MSYLFRFAIILIVIITKLSAQNLSETRIRCDSFYDAGNYQATIPLAEKCVELAKKEFGDQDTIYASMLHRLANSQVRMNQNEAAESNYRASLKIRQTMYGENSSSCATSLHGLGNAVLQQDRLLDAQQILLKSLQIREDIKQKPVRQAAATLNSLGIIAINLGNISEAETYFQKTCDRYRDLFGENSKDYVVALGNLAQCNSQIGNYERSLPMLRKSLKLREKLYSKNHPLYASALQGLGEFYIKTDNYTAGEPFIRASLAIREKKLGMTHANTLNSMDLLATVFLETGRMDSAELILREMIGRYDTLFDATDGQRAGFMNSLGEVLLRKNQLKNAQICFETALFLQKDKIDDGRVSYLQSLQELARTSFLLGQFARADSLYKSAQLMEFGLFTVLFPHFSERERQIYFKPRALEIERYATFTAAAEAEIPSLGGQLLDLRMATRGILFSASQKMREQFRRSGNLSEYEKWRQARERLANLTLTPPDNPEKLGFSSAELNESIRVLEKKLGYESATFRQENDKISFNWQNLRDALAPNEAAVEIMRFRKQGFEESNDIVYIGILVTRETTDQPIFIHFGDGNELETIFFDLYQNEILQPQPLSTRKNSPAFRNFWLPIQAVLGDKNRVYFALDGVFHKINLGTLRALDGHFLSETYDFRYLTNLADLPRTRQLNSDLEGVKPPRKSSNALLVGNPTFNLSEDISETAGRNFMTISSENLRTIVLRPLPEAEAEVLEINQLLLKNGWNSTFYTQKLALESLVKSADSVAILHLATHGFFLENNLKLLQNDTTYAFHSPLMRSVLFFAGAENLLKSGQMNPNDAAQDGILTAFEVQNMSLDFTELVTLSACETGLGDVMSGEGVFGLQRAFQIAGAKSLLMSLWQVDDCSTHLLMTVFYEKWLGGATKMEALKFAESVVRAKYPEPVKWGGFVLVGE